MPSELAGPERLPDFAERVLEIVDLIPAGTVLAYGDIAELLGEGGPRQVGSVMSRYGSSVTWWRVIRASGEAPAHLQEEAVARWRKRRSTPSDVQPEPAVVAVTTAEQTSLDEARD